MHKALKDMKVCMIIYDDDTVSLKNTFICYGLDAFGDFSEDHEYHFNSLEEIIIYLENKLKIKLKDMKKLDLRNIVSQINSTREQTEVFKKEWDRFRQDFDSGKFLNKNLKLINS